MSGTIVEFFGYVATDRSEVASSVAESKICPFLGKQCTKILSRDRTVSGVCAIKQKTPGTPWVICCPVRLYAENHKILKTIASRVFGEGINLYAGRIAVEKAVQEPRGAIAVFGHGWGGELRLPQRKGGGSYFVDWVLAHLNERGELIEFTAIEVQTIDTTGSYRIAQEALAERREVISDTVGLNWENVSKRILPQLIYKGQVLQGEDLCKAGLFFVCPKPIYERVLNRLGGVERLPTMPTQPASIHFVGYDYAPESLSVDGEIKPLDIVVEHSTAVYKIQEAFSALNLPDRNVYGAAIRRNLYG